jgi:GNAT superfamily N-acetyltransferase
MSTRIEQINTRTAAEGTLRALHELHLARDAELAPPGDPPIPYEQRFLDWRNVFESEAAPRWVLWDGADVVATSFAYLDLTQNLENAYGGVYVHPRRRGEGLGREITTPMFDAIEADGRTRFALEINQGRAEEVLAARAGMKPALTEKRSRLSLPDLDWSLMDRWVKKAEERASDYELLFFAGSVPDEHLEAFCGLTSVMNTAPRDDLEEEDEIITPEIWRDVEAKERARRTDILSYVARHKPTGGLAGFTTVFCPRLRPDLIWQGDTGVDPAHRNRGIGRWLKAAMALRIKESHPEARRIDTYNAGSNAPMLSINLEMGFRPIMIETVWQGDLATLRDRLSV